MEPEKKGYASASCFLQQPSGKREGMYVGSSGGIDIYKVPKNSSSQRFIHAAQADCGLKVGEKGAMDPGNDPEKKTVLSGMDPYIQI